MKLLTCLLMAVVVAQGAWSQTDNGERWHMRQGDVVFMYGPKDPAVYEAYGCNVLLWGSAGAATVAKEKGVHCQSSIWFLTAWGDKLAKDPELLKAVCVDLEGKPIEVPWLTDHKQAMPNYWGCTNAPYYREYLKQQAVNATQAADVKGLHIDDHCGTAACASYAGGCFCEHCRSGFRKYLQAEYTPAQLAELGVKDVESFDYAEYVKQFAATRADYQKQRLAIPLFVPFITFQARGEASLVGEIRELVTQKTGRVMSMSANCGLPSPLHLADYLHLDTLCGEIGLGAGAGKPSTTSHLAYKVADGVKRPLAATASGWDWAWIGEKNKPGLVKTWVAESYAFGNRLMAPHHQWAYTAEKGTHWWDGRQEDFAPLYKWISTHRNLFDGFENVSNVVVIFNTPGAYRGQDKASEIAAYLAPRNLQYRVAVAGGEWVPERLRADDLAQAQKVIVSCREHLDQPQQAALESVKGKTIAWTGPASLEGQLPEGITVQGAESVWALVRRNAATGEVALHLLNRNYDLAQDRTLPTGPLTVSIPASLAGAKTSAAAYSVPGEAVPADLKRDGDKLTVAVPPVDLWSIIILK